jgi:hypothetical protein
MRLNFYGFDPSYHVARYNFIHKIAKSRTPLTLARHRSRRDRALVSCKQETSSNDHVVIVTGARGSSRNLVGSDGGSLAPMAPCLRREEPS